MSSNNLPAVSFLKAPANETGHPSTSSPLAEQTFLVDTINRLQQSPEWKDMAILIAWDDSDGWYDHVLAPIVSTSERSGERCTARTGGALRHSESPEPISIAAAMARGFHSW